MSNSELFEVDQEFSKVEMEDFLRNAFEREFGEDEIPRVELQISNSALEQRIREFDLVNFG